MKNSTTIFISKTPVGWVNSPNLSLCERELTRRFHVGKSKLPWKEAFKVRFEQESGNSIDACKEPDGSVWGVRYFRAVRPGFLMSPTSLYVWETCSAEATDFSNAEAVRGHVGFHAAWVEDLNRWAESTVDHGKCEAKALVRGFGDIVLGDEGWRSSKLKIVSVVLDITGLPLRSALEKRYQGVAFGEGFYGNREVRLELNPEYERFYEMKKLYAYVEVNELMEEYK